MAQNIDHLKQKQSPLGALKENVEQDLRLKADLVLKEKEHFGQKKWLYTEVIVRAAKKTDLPTQDFKALCSSLRKLDQINPEEVKARYDLTYFSVEEALSKGISSPEELAIIALLSLSKKAESKTDNNRTSPAERVAANKILAHIDERKLVHSIYELSQKLS